MKVTDKTSHFSLIWGGGYRNKSLSKSLGAAVFLSFGSSGGPLGPLGLLDEQKRSRWRLRIQNSENVPFWVYPPVPSSRFFLTCRIFEREIHLKILPLRLLLDTMEALRRPCATHLIEVRRGGYHGSYSLHVVFRPYFPCRTNCFGAQR